MKKVFFVFAVAAGIAMTACNNKPAGEATTTTDTTAVTTAVTTTTTDTTKMAADTTKMAADTTAAKK
jgi:hypothetical protein